MLRGIVGIGIVPAIQFVVSHEFVRTREIKSRHILSEHGLQKHSQAKCMNRAVGVIHKFAGNGGVVKIGDHFSIEN